MKILLLNGANLNRLGMREPAIYGTQSLSTLIAQLRKQAEQATATLVDYQSNSEAHLIERIHQAADDNTDFLIINAGAYTHTSIALRDALLGVAIPFIEVHLSNIYAREPFRHHSYLSDIAQGTITGLGTFGYTCALSAALQHPLTPKE